MGEPIKLKNQQKTVSISLWEDVFEELEKYCIKIDTNRSQVVNQAIKSFLLLKWDMSAAWQAYLKRHDIGKNKEEAETSTTPPLKFKKIPHSITNSKRYDIMKRDGFKCVLCGVSASEGRLEIDHIIPRSKGGDGKDNNLRTICYNCNRGKKAKIEQEAVPKDDQDSIELLTRGTSF